MPDRYQKFINGEIHDIREPYPINGPDRKDIMALFFVTFGFVGLLMFMQWASYRGYVLNLFVFKIDYSSDNPSIFPYKYLISALSIMSAIYGGVEGTFSLMKTMKLGSNNTAHLPFYKVIRLRYILFGWFVLSIFGSVLQRDLSHAVGGSVDLYLTDIYIGLSTILVTYSYATRISKVGTNVHIGKGDIKEPSDGMTPPMMGGGPPI